MSLSESRAVKGMMRTLRRESDRSSTLQRSGKSGIAGDGVGNMMLGGAEESTPPVANLGPPRPLQPRCSSLWETQELGDSKQTHGKDVMILGVNGVVMPGGKAHLQAPGETLVILPPGLDGPTTACGKRRFCGGMPPPMSSTGEGVRSC